MYRFLFLFIFFSQVLSAQMLSIDSIYLIGNERTKDFVILNELLFSQGDSISISNRDAITLRNELRLESMGIFNDAEIHIKANSPTTCDITIDLEENWFIWPRPIFELSDRNFTEWWVNNDHDWNRVNYGVGLDHINLTGRRDEIDITLQRGYTKKYELRYAQPYLTDNRFWGMDGFVYFSNQKELPYITLDNQSIFGGHDGEVMLSRFRAGLGVFYRKNVFKFHAFRIEYHKNEVDSYVIEELNPNYFLNGTSIQFLYFSYNFDYNRIDFPFYPRGGFRFNLELKKEGFGIFKEYDNLSLATSYERYHTIHKKWIIGSNVKVKFNILRNRVSFANNSALGYSGDFITGYTSNVIDGTDFFYIKNTVRYQLLDYKWVWKDWMIIRQFKVMDIAIFLRMDFDLGYINERHYIETNTLNNQLIYGAGPAFDLMLYNNYRASARYEFNHRGEGAFILEYNVAF